MTIPTEKFPVDTVGATAADWQHFAVTLGLRADLVPVVANPDAPFSKHSTLKEKGKTPSEYTRDRKIAGIPKWTSHEASAAQINQWAGDPDLGICVITRSMRAIDVDVVDHALATRVREIIEAFLFAEELPDPALRTRADSSKFLMPIWLLGTYPKRTIRTVHGIIEFLGNGQQFVAMSTHPCGQRYEWNGPGGLPAVDAVPRLTSDQFERLWALLDEQFGTEPAIRQRDVEHADVDAEGRGLDRTIALAQVNDDTIKDLRSAIATLREEADEYGQWIEVGQALKSLEQGGRGDEGADLWHEFSRLSGKYDFDEAEEKWATFDPLDITYRTVFDLAAARGWVNPRSAVALQARVEDRSALEEERRRHQIEENRRLGDGAVRPPAAEIIDLEGALRRFVFLSEGSRVADVFNPHYDLAFADWAATHAASKAEVPQRPRALADGKTKELPPKLVPVSGLWQSNRLRQTAVCRTFKADGPATLLDPDGRFALNSWKPFDRSLHVDDLAAAGIDLFVEQVRFLFGAEADRFLDWLAHIEQFPGVLPHTAWLHVATNFGMGRNWLASVLARVWAGSVASNLDLVDMLDSGFNGRLSRKVLATVDEIREGGRGEQWAHAERLKSLINEETRSINPKYGRRTLEFNACRWLVMSNHISALPIEDRDRRWQVVINEQAPREPAWYSSLYRALDDPRFIAAVATFLRQRDLSGFNPGEKASETQAKAAVVQASKSSIDQWVDLIRAHWPCDVAPSALLAHVLGVADEGGLSPAHRRALERGGIASVGRVVRIDGHPTRLSIVRRKAEWVGRDAGELRAEWERGRAHLDVAIAEGGLRDYLSGAAADAEVAA